MQMDVFAIITRNQRNLLISPADDRAVDQTADVVQLDVEPFRDTRPDLERRARKRRERERERERHLF